jgi:hypothetical protein
MRSFIRQYSLAAALLSLGTTAAFADNPIDGRWDANLQTDKATIPFRLDISGDGATLKGTLYNGEDKEYTTEASWKDGVVVLNLEHYLTKITATYKDGKIAGKVEMRGEKAPKAAVSQPLATFPLSWTTPTSPRSPATGSSLTTS